MKKKMWHCKYCGNTQDAKDSVCRICGNDLVIYGDVVFEENEDEGNNKEIPTMIADLWQTGDNNVTPSQQQDMNYNNVTSSYQQDMNYNNNTPSYQQGNNGGVSPYQQGNNGGVSPYQQYGSDADNGKSGGKKGIIALIAVFLVAAVSVAAVFLLTGDKKKKDNTTEKYDYPSYSTTTTKPTTTKPTTTAPTTTRPTTTKPAQKAYIPEFAAYAEEYVISYNSQQKMDGKNFYSSTYTLDSDLCYDVVADYMAFLMSEDYCFEFSTDEFFSDSASDVAAVGHYTGTADVDEITYESDGNEYSGELFIFMSNNESTGYTTVIMLYDDDFTVWNTRERADIDTYDANAAVLPDYEQFANGRATVYDSEYDSAEGIYTVWYKEETTAGMSGILTWYKELLDEKYAYDEENYYGDMDWFGYSYNGTEDVSEFTTTFSDGKAFYGNSVTIRAHSYQYYVLIEISYVDEIELVSPLYTYDDTH